MTVVLINPNRTESMTEAMVSAARMAVPGLDLEGWTSHDGPSAIQGRSDGEAASLPLLALADRAEAMGATGVIIGCFDDTALDDVRARLSCPVVGIGQAAYTYCALRGWRFSVVTTLPVSIPVLEENIASYGLSPLVGAIRASDIPVLEIEASHVTSSVQILKEAKAARAQDGIDAIVLGCAGMVHVTSHLRANLNCPVIDPVEAAAGCLAWLSQRSAH